MSCDLLSQLRNRGMFDKHFMEVHSFVLVAYESTLESIPYRCFALRTFNRFQFHVVLQVKPVVLVWKEQQQKKKSALQTKRAAVLLLSCGTNLKDINMARPFNRSQSSAEVTSQLDLYTAVIFLKGKHVTSHPGYHKHLLEKPTRSTVNSFFVGHLILPNSQLGGLLNPRYLKTCHSYIYISYWNT